MSELQFADTAISLNLSLTQAFEIQQLYVENDWIIFISQTGKTTTHNIHPAFLHCVRAAIIEISRTRLPRRSEREEKKKTTGGENRPRRRLLLLRPKSNCLFPVTRPTLNFLSNPKTVFIICLWTNWKKTHQNVELFSLNGLFRLE